ncbi:MAG: dihydrofolate reductase [Prevotella sp.]
MENQKLTYPHLCLIVAMSPHRAIGAHGTLPWHIKEDLDHFKQLTWGHTVLMGRQTYESLPHGALPGRRNIVLSHTMRELPGCEVYASFEEALHHCRLNEQVFVMGGASVYREALPIASHLYITMVEKEPADADTFFPTFDESEWREVKHEQHAGFAFTEWRRNTGLKKVNGSSSERCHMVSPT